MNVKLHAPAAERNREPILSVLREVLPAKGVVLEIASGTGQHAVYFASQFPDLRWIPSDPDPGARASIEAWRRDSGLANLAEPLAIDATEDRWGVVQAEAVVSINMIHIAPWAACQGLLRGASGLLQPSAPLILYGPFIVDGVMTAESNLEFDRSLRSRNPEWGIRGLDAVISEARLHGLAFERHVAMPANNYCVVFRKSQ